MLLSCMPLSSLLSVTSCPLFPKVYVSLSEIYGIPCQTWTEEPSPSKKSMSGILLTYSNHHSGILIVVRTDK